MSDRPVYPNVVQQILTPKRLMELGPGKPQRERFSQLSQLTPDLLVGGRRIANSNMARCCLAALWLYHDFLDESHRISQDIGSTEGSYWHGIMHRREPDAWNSKYWFRRVGNHPVIDALATDARSLGYEYRSPFEFVDDCERARGTNSATEERLRRVQMLEWRLLFDYCWQHALETNPEISEHQ